MALKHFDMKASIITKSFLTTTAGFGGWKLHEREWFRGANLHLSAIRRLADEAAETCMLSPELAIGIRRVKGVKRLGRRIGNWLTGNQAQDLLNSIPQTALRGKRDAALIGLLLGCGLRRSEAVALRLDQIQQREEHWIIADLSGKGGRLRTVPVPTWCKALIGIHHLAPHDLRRTCAQLCHGAGGELEQIQFLLGHASVQTTERYIGCRQKLREVVNDRFSISLVNTA